jgi:hypothetical protein
MDRRGIASVIKRPCELFLLGFKHTKADVKRKTSSIWGNSRLMTGVLRLDRVTPRARSRNDTAIMYDHRWLIQPGKRYSVIEGDT